MIFYLFLLKLVSSYAHLLMVSFSSLTSLVLVLQPAELRVEEHWPHTQKHCPVLGFFFLLAFNLSGVIMFTVLLGMICFIYFVCILSVCLSVCFSLSLPDCWLSRVVGRGTGRRWTMKKESNPSSQNSATPLMVWNRSPSRCSLMDGQID